MSTENDDWRYNSDEERPGAGRDGNRSYNREGGYNRPSYNREGGDRPYTPRPRFNPNGDRPQRPRFNNDGGGDRPYRPRYNNNGEGGDRPYTPRPRYNSGEGVDGNSYNRPQRPRYNNNGEGGGNRPYTPRPRYNSGEGGGDRPYTPRPRYNNGEGGEGGERPYTPRPRYNNGGGYNNNGGGYNRGGGYNSGGGYNRGGDRPYSNRPQRRSADYDPNAKYSRKKQIEYKEQFTDPNEPIRLNKFLANAGVCSRREADEFITAGVVTVNGEVVIELGTKIKRSDEVKFHDQTVSIERKIYVLLNKPKDCVTTSDDPQARKTVMDLVKGACTERIYPVGRLDRNTTGVLLLTNDGDLASKLTHPKFLKKKIYHVHLDKNLTRADMDQIAEGIQLDDGEIHADEISYIEDKKDEVGIEIHSGKNRIVRRIFESLGYKVTKLDRVFFAGLTKKGLRRGDWRYLSEAEVNFLRMGSFE